MFTGADSTTAELKTSVSKLRVDSLQRHFGFCSNCCANGEQNKVYFKLGSALLVDHFSAEMRSRVPELGTLASNSATTHCSACTIFFSPLPGAAALLLDAATCRHSTFLPE